MEIWGFEASVLAACAGAGALLALAGWFGWRAAGKRKRSAASNGKPVKRTNKEVMRERKDRRRAEHARTEDRMRAELERCQQRLVAPDDAVREAVREVVERDPEQAARTVRSMMRKP